MLWENAYLCLGPWRWMIANLAATPARGRWQSGKKGHPLILHPLMRLNPPPCEDTMKWEGGKEKERGFFNGLNGHA